MGRELAKAGFSQAFRGNLVESEKGKRERFWIVRNANIWLGATHGDIVRHIQSPDDAPKHPIVRPKSGKF